MNNAWARIEGAAHKLAVAPNGDLWAINYRSYEIYRLKYGASNWETIPDLGVEITATFDGTIYMLGMDVDASNNNQIYKWNSSACAWNKVQGGAIRISGGPGKTLWTVKADLSIIYSSNPPMQ